ncbi:mannosyltransferase [Winogradskyella sp. J14-2]|uniref:mannosyltransferase n=1 Tax=Winogradskyella sp. J14-2 TaxID=1936080 RepID=UPI001E397984|nr:mannosyltransferase [Winogradskyella sp. J14-2]
MTHSYKHKKTTLAYILVSCILYVWFAYFTARTDALQVVLLYGILFVLGYYILKAFGFYISNSLGKGYRVLALVSVLFRILLLFAIPNLSQDFYRFIWDGQMLLEGFNPYLYKPDNVILWNTSISSAQELYDGMGKLSASHFTNYPPLNQLCFVLGNLFPGKTILTSVIGMRLIIIAADIGTLYFGKKILEVLKLPSNRIFWYILNPFIIIELTGNLHFEGVMIFFLVWSLYLLHKGYWKWAAVIYACSISVKLIPLMFLPLFFGWFLSTSSRTTLSTSSRTTNSTSLSNQKNSQRKWISYAESKGLFAFAGITKLIVFYTIVGITLIVFFLPFFSIEFVDNYSKTVALWFNNFEFNASIYYILRAIGYSLTGYNEIGFIGKILPVIPVLFILGFSFLKTNNSIPKLSNSFLLVLTIYLFFSTTVHPWYIASLVILCVFTNYRYPLIWSAVIILSYLSYLGIGTADKAENLWIIALEYTIVFLVFTWEVILKKRLPIL